MMASAKLISLGLFVLVCLTLASSVRILQDSETTKLSKHIHAHYFHQGHGETSGGENDDDGGRDGAAHGSENDMDSLRHNRGSGDSQSPHVEERTHPFIPGYAERVKTGGKQDVMGEIKPNHEKQDDYGVRKPYITFDISDSKEKHYDQVEINYYPGGYAINEPKPPGLEDGA